MLKGFERGFKPLEMLTEEQVEAIHRATLQVVDGTGIRVEHDEALKLLEKNGCRVDSEKRRVRFPPGLVEDCLRKCPSSFLLKARDPQKHLRVGGNTVYCTNAAGVRYVDLDTWEARPASKKEHDDIYVIADAMDNLHLTSPVYLDLEGVPQCTGFSEVIASKIRNSSKAIFQGSTLDSEIFCIQMAEAVGINYLGLACPAPPLTLQRDTCDSMF